MEATFGIFIPSFLFVAILNPIIPKMRKPKIISAFLDAINVGAVAVIMAVAVEMGRESLTDLWTFEITLSVWCFLFYQVREHFLYRYRWCRFGIFTYFFLKKYWLRHQLMMNLKFLWNFDSNQK